MGNLKGLRNALTQLTGGILFELGNLTNLERLSLDNDPLGGSIPEELGNLSNLIELLFLDRNELSGEIPSANWAI